MFENNLWLKEISEKGKMLRRGLILCLYGQAVDRKQNVSFVQNIRKWTKNIIGYVKKIKNVSCIMLRIW